MRRSPALMRALHRKGQHGLVFVFVLPPDRNDVPGQFVHLWKVFGAPVSFQLETIRRSLSLGSRGVRRVFVRPQLYRLGELFETDGRIPVRSRDELVSVRDQGRDLADVHVTVRIEFGSTWLESGLQGTKRLGGEAVLEKVQ